MTLLDAGADALAVNADGAGVLSQVAAKVSRGTRSKVRAATRVILLRAAPQLRVLLLHHEDCAGHVSVKPHQESPERIAAVLASLAKSAATGALSSDETLVSTDFEPAGIEHLARCHSEEYISVITELGNAWRTRRWRSLPTTRITRACRRRNRNARSSATPSSPRGPWRRRCEPREEWYTR